jgi:anti-sigma factor RsiW
MAMTSRTKEWHYTPEELADYFDDEMSDDEISEVRDHLGRCKACLELANRVSERMLLVEEWTARAPGEASLPGRVAGALEEARRVPEVGTVWGERLARWGRVGITEGGAVRVIIQRLADAPRLVTRVVTRLLLSGATPEFALEGLRTRRPGAVRVLGESRPSQAEAVTDASAGETPPPEGDLVVRVPSLPPGPAPLVAVVSLASEAPALLQELQRPSGETAWVARFEDLPPGEYVVAFEPGQQTP